MKINRILYGALGVLLLAGTVATANYGLSAENKQIYADALGLQEQVDEIGFEGFQVEDYKVRFFDGEVDYVIKGDQTQKEKAVFTTFVGTTYEVEGEYQVLLPTVENFSKMFELLGSAENLAEGEMNFSEQEYGSTEHTGTLWHEAMHAYQMTHYQKEILSVVEGKTSQENFEDIIVSSVDSNENVVKLYEKQMEILTKAYKAEDLNEKKRGVAEYLQLEQERCELLSDEARCVEKYYEIAEGTARYIESRIYGLLEGEEAFERDYTENTAYQKGSGKYYASGMLKCYLLDQLDLDWKKGYDFSVSLNDLLQAL